MGATLGIPAWGTMPEEKMMLELFFARGKEDGGDAVGCDLCHHDAAAAGKIKKWFSFDSPFLVSSRGRYRAVTSAYYPRGALGVMLIYDITKRQRFDHMAQWLEELRNHADKNLVMMLIGNKTDIEDQRAVSKEDAKEFARKEGLLFLETSALGSTNVEPAFLTTRTEIFNITNKNLASVEQANGDASTLTGKMVVIPGPAQEIPKKKMRCTRNLSGLVTIGFIHMSPLFCSLFYFSYFGEKLGYHSVKFL